MRARDGLWYNVKDVYAMDCATSCASPVVNPHVIPMSLRSHRPSREKGLQRQLHVFVCQRRPRQKDSASPALGDHHGQPF